MPSWQVEPHFVKQSCCLLNMEVKGILDKIRHQEKEKKEYFFALEFGPKLVKSAIWLVEKGKIKVVSLGTTETWEDEEAFLAAVDSSLSSASENFNPEEETEEPNKVIFGLPVDWVEEEKITPARLKTLKALSTKLEIEPVGFVITTEAISHYLRQTEGVPPTAILISLGSEKIFLTLLRLGKIEETQEVKRSQSLGDDLLEGLSRYSEVETFPARILLYNGQEGLEVARQELVEYPWQEGEVKGKEVVFLHLPKVEVLPQDFDIKSVALAGGKEVVRASGIMADFVEKSKEVPSSSEKTEGRTPAKIEQEAKLEKTDFGFIEGRDIQEIESSEKPGAEKERKDSSILPPSSVPKKTSGFSRVGKFTFFLSWLDFLKPAKLVSLFSAGAFKAKFENRSSLILSLVVLSLAILVGAGGILYWYLPKAEVLLLVEPKTLEEKFEVKFDPSLSSASTDELTLPASRVRAIIKGAKSIGTTGTKVTGEKARGEVTVYNGTSVEKTFDSGTLITSSGGLEFSLDEDVKVASQSSAADPPGKAVVGITAAEIGPEANLASGTEFAIANYAKSDYVAKNESALTGGTSREIQVVSQEDHDNLLDDLTKDLESQSIEALAAEVASGETLIEDSIETSVIKKEYDREIDEESVEVGLALELELSAFAYNEEEMYRLVDEIIDDKVPQGYEFKEEESDKDFRLDEISEDGVAVFSVGLSAKLSPIIDVEEIKQKLVGKRPSLAKSYLDNLPSVVGVEIKIKPRFPSKILTLPRVAKNIKIEIKIK